MTKRPTHPKPDIYVTIYCEDASHKDDPWILGTWELLAGEPGAPPHWQYVLEHYFKGEFFRNGDKRHYTGGKIVAHTESGPEFLDYENNVDDRLRMVDYEMSGIKISSRIRLKCHHCGRNVKRASNKFEQDLFTFVRLVGSGDLELGLYQRVVMPATDRLLK